MKPTCFSLLGAAFLCLAAACSPEVVTMSVDMRYPSVSGHDLSRHSMAVVCMDEGRQDSLFNAALATGLAESLENDYFGGKESIDIYRIPVDTVTLDLMHSLVMDTGNSYVGGNYGFVSSHAANSFGVAIITSLIMKNRTVFWSMTAWARRTNSTLMPVKACSAPRSSTTASRPPNI